MTPASVSSSASSWKRAVEFIVKLAENNQENSPALADANLNKWLTDRRLYPAVARHIAEMLKKDAGDSINEGCGAVCLPRIPRATEIVPVLCGFKYDADLGFSVRLVLIRWLSSSQKPENVVGLRFESPHGSPDGDGGAHSFHHSQMLALVVKGDEKTRVSDVDEWALDSQPSFPIQATTPCDLLWAAAVTAYGKAEATLPFRGDHEAVRELSRYLKALQ
jgi:hypothetical protein